MHQDPRIDQEKTECPYCGEVWQEHTLDQTDACMAIMHAEYYRATKKAGRAIEPEVITCPVCSKLFEEHSDADFAACLGKLRKREEGSTGLEIQSHFVTSGFAGQDPDPGKREQMRAQMFQMPCSCGKALGDHTPDEVLACHRK